MKTFTVAAIAVSATLGVEAFSTGALPSQRSSLTVVNGYVPDGFTPESYKKFKEEERKKNEKKNLGRVGPKGFKSRRSPRARRDDTFAPCHECQRACEKGELKWEDIPYMQRGGSWDNSDLKGAKKVRWLDSDRDYASGGYLKEQSVSIFGKGQGLDWTGTRTRSGPAESVPGAAPKFAKNYKAPNVNTMKGVTVNDEQPKKKFFGLF